MAPKKQMKKAPRRRRAPRMRMMRRPRHIIEKAAAQYATLSAPLFPNSNVYSFKNFALNNASSRVQVVANAYQFYRIKRVTWQVRPAYDTFIATGTGGATGYGTSVPQLYWRLDRDGNYNSSTTLQTLKASGCKPIRLDDKIITKSFAPSVLQAVAQGPTDSSGALDLVLGSKRISPWLPTNANAYSTLTTAYAPSSIDHLGLLISIDQDAGVNSSVPCAYISFVVEFEFKKPLSTGSLGEVDSTTQVDLATLQPEYKPPTASVLTSAV